MEMISFHTRKLTGTPDDNSSYAYGWQCADVAEIDRIAKCILNYVWSPIRWSRDVRAQANFLEARLIGLDFDRDVKIEDVKEKFKDHWHIIGTTRNHQLEKNGLVCDRFRLILKADAVVDNLGYYRSIVDGFIKEMKADPACRDGARFFFPCTDIYSKDDGLEVCVVDALMKHRPKPTRLYPKTFEPAQDKSISAWIINCLENGVPPGDRNNTVFRMVGNLLSRGFTKDEIQAMICSSAIPADDFNLEEINAIVANARPRTSSNSTEKNA